MEPNKILNADVLDIIFEGRNKEYGAYELRKTYNSRLRHALIGTSSVVLLLLAGYFVSNMNGEGKKQALMVTDHYLEEYKQEKKIEPAPIKIEKPQIKQLKITTLLIVRDDKVKEEDRPPEVDKIDDAKIGNMNVAGEKDNGITAPPVSDGKAVVEAPRDNEDYDKTFTKVEIESEYPGGAAAWQRYLSKNLHYPDEAVSNEIQGDIVVQFIVDKEGNVSDVEAISGPNELREQFA